MSDYVYTVSIHAPVRERHGASVRIIAGSVVSIHAPVRERRHFQSTEKTTSGFNSRSREGATNLSVSHTTLICFNSRSREGATRRTTRLLCARRRFNSRSREGATIAGRLNNLVSRVSIHAPVRERQTIDIKTLEGTMFQFTLP